MTNLSFFNFLRFIAIMILATVAFPLDAKKIYPALCGCVYLHSGDTIMADGELHVGMPKKKQKLRIIENAYTARNKIQQQLDPETIDSLVLWSRTAPERPHTFIYAKGYGWCHLAEQCSRFAVLCYATKGFKCSGNGGLWYYGKGEMLILKDGVIHRLGQPHKKIDKKMRARLENIFADDPRLLEYIRTADGRCDKVLRSLVINPKSN